MTIIGITGGSGSGKTTLLTEASKRQVLTIDCDLVYRELLVSNSELLTELNSAFPGVVTDGVLDRKKLGAIVFADSEKLRMLNLVTHKYVDAEVTRLLSEAMTTFAAIDAIALLESTLEDICSSVVAVVAPTETRIERIIKREGISREYALSRIEAQHSNEWFAEHSDYLLDNSGTEEEFTFKCNCLLDELLK